MKTKILYVLTRAPFPMVDGTRERIMGELDLLSHDFDIDLLIITSENITNNTVEKLKQIGVNEVIIFNIHSYHAYLNSFLTLFTNKPLQSSYFYNAKAYKWLENNEKNYKTIYFHTLRFGRYIDKLKKNRIKSTCRLLLGFNDAISLNYKDAGIKAKGLWKVIYKIESNRIKNYELKLLTIVDSASIINKRDRDYILHNWHKNLPKLTKPKIHVIRHSICDDLLSYNYHPENNNLVFIGNLKYPPNRQGLDFFCSQLWPGIIKEIKNIKLIVIGRDGEKFSSEYPNVEALGFVDDPYQIMIKQAAFISPADFGAGVPSKTLLAMSLGLPVISTYNNAAGIEEIANDVNICLIDYKNPEESISKIINAIKNEKYRLKIGREGKKIIINNYLQSNNYNILKSFINNAIS